MDISLKINLITKTYNSEKILPYFFKHYDQFVTNYYIWDNMSTDGTRGLLIANPKVTMFDNLETEFDDYKHKEFKNNAWKGFKDCDFIINCDVDEFLYHPNIETILSECKECNHTLIGSYGYQMFSEKYPTEDFQIYDIIKTGIREMNYDKPIIFNPEINPEYSFGAHKCLNHYYVDCGIKLLHFKMIGKEFIEDILKRNERLSARNKKERLSLWPNEKGDRFNPYEVWEYMKQNAKEVI